MTAWNLGSVGYQTRHSPHVPSTNSSVTGSRCSMFSGTDGAQSGFSRLAESLTSLASTVTVGLDWGLGDECQRCGTAATVPRDQGNSDQQGKGRARGFRIDFRDLTSARTAGAAPSSSSSSSSSSFPPAAREYGPCGVGH
jgi:hypothetical protein